MALQPNYIYTTYTQGFPHLDTPKQTKCFDRNFLQYTSNIIVSEKANPLENKQADDSSFLFADITGFMNTLSCVYCLPRFPHVLPTVISYSDHSQENKAAITVVHYEACLWRIDQDCVSI